MSPHKNNKEIPDWKLERFLIGELPPEEMARLRREEEKSSSFRKRLEALRESDRDILEKYPVASMSRLILNRTGQSAGSRMREKARTLSRFWALPALPIAAVILLLTLFPALFDRGDRDQPGPDFTRMTRIKGSGASLSLHRKTDSGSEQLKDGDPAHEHDLILIQYQPAGKMYGVILSIDGRGTINRHLPEKGQWAGLLEQEGSVPLDFAYELDDAPDWEKFYFVTSDSMFEVSTVIRAALDQARHLSGDEAGSLELPDYLEESTFTIRKAKKDE